VEGKGKKIRRSSALKGTIAELKKEKEKGGKAGGSELERLSGGTGGGRKGALARRSPKKGGKEKALTGKENKTTVRHSQLH